ncbi:GrpB family protein [Acinetobacter lactucae]|uniref:GrpB family protein n=1 Tax=Acinetobacter lactucae TaxID=1785128 RepID=UPI00077E11A1|nr:GrpB family protein [Acinetobacter lactucae]
MVFLEPEQYQQRCAQLFNSYHKAICTLLPFAKIEHIGSSAIPNAISKGDLDIYIEVMPEQFECTIERLKTLNFIEKPNTLRAHELCMLESLNDDDVAFQIVVSDSIFTFFLTFKNKLIESPTLVNEYNQLKLQCKHLDPDQYRTMKSDFINRVLNQP